MASVLEDAPLQEWLQAAKQESWTHPASEVGHFQPAARARPPQSGASRTAERSLQAADAVPRHAAWSCCSLTFIAAASASAAAPFTVEDLVRLKRISDPQISPDGDVLAFVQRETDMDANRGRTSLWLLDLREPGAEPQRAAGGDLNDSSPRWAQDGRTLYFLSNRSGSSQVWRLNLPALAAQKVTDYPLEVGTLRVAPRGELLALTMEVFPDCASLACTRERLDQAAKDKASGRLYARLFIRHWDSWSDGTRAHVFTATLSPRRRRRRPARPRARPRRRHAQQALRRRRGLRLQPRRPACGVLGPHCRQAASRGRPTSICSRARWTRSAPR